jgi:phage shock protein PspC (stress-responsive transcriptional regulator)
VTQIPIFSFERRERDRVVAGVCGGIADALDVDPTLVRLVFALLSLAGGAGILLYFALWLWTGGRHPTPAVLVLALAAMSLLGALGEGFQDELGAGVIGAGLLIVGGRGAASNRGDL